MGKQTAKVVWGRRRYRLKADKKDLATSEVYIRASKEIEEKGLDEEISQMLISYERGDEKIVDDFTLAVEYCLEGIKETLSRSGIVHERFIWESQFVRSGEVRNVIAELSKSKSARKEDGALILNLSDFGLEKEMVLTRRDGTSLYIARDLAHHIWKLKQGTAVNVWGADHKLVAEQLKAGLSILGYDVPEFIIHEFISLPEGGMSTRKGVFITADQLLDGTVKQAYKEVLSRRPGIGVRAEEIAEDIGVSAVRFNIARIAPEKSMTFRWEEALDFERQGSPFIQYAYARGKKILKKGGKRGTLRTIPNIEWSERRLIRAVSSFPLIVKKAATSRKVSTIANYAIDLSIAFHSFYMSSKVLGSEKEDFRIHLVDAAVTTLGNVMEILGIRRLDEM